MTAEQKTELPDWLTPDTVEIDPSNLVNQSAPHTMPASAEDQAEQDTVRVLRTFGGVKSVVEVPLNDSPSNRARLTESRKRARQMIGQFVETNIHQMDTLLNRVAMDDPLSAFQCFRDLLEFHIPKLQRIEQTGEDGGAIETRTLSADNHRVVREIQLQQDDC